MRLENFGQEVKKGLLEGTKLWKYRNGIIAGVLAFTFTVDACVILYYNSRKEETRFKRESVKHMKEKERESIQLKMKYYEKILAKATDLPSH